MTAGRPTDYRPEYCQVAADLAAQGATDFEIAEALGVADRTLYRWKNQHPEFRQAIKIAGEIADERVERTLYTRAVGYSFESVKILKGSDGPIYAPYVEHVPPDVGAAKMWLTNRKSQDWRERQEVTGADGKDLIPPQMSDTDLARRIAFLLTAGVTNGS